MLPKSSDNDSNKNEFPFWLKLRLAFSVFVHSSQSDIFEFRTSMLCLSPVLLQKQLQMCQFTFCFEINSLMNFPTAGTKNWFKFLKKFKAFWMHFQIVLQSILYCGSLLKLSSNSLAADNTFRQWLNVTWLSIWCINCGHHWPIIVELMKSILWGIVLKMLNSQTFLPFDHCANISSLEHSNCKHCHNFESTVSAIHMQFFIWQLGNLGKPMNAGPNFSCQYEHGHFCWVFAFMHFSNMKQIPSVTFLHQWHFSLLHVRFTDSFLRWEEWIKFPTSFRPEVSPFAFHSSVNFCKCLTLAWMHVGQSTTTQVCSPSPLFVLG